MTSNKHEKFRISIITQEDAFVIPKNVDRLFSLNGLDVVSIYTISAKGSFDNKYMLFLKGFGLCQSAMMGFRMFAAKIFDRVDRLFRGRLPGTKASIRAVAIKHGVHYLAIQQVGTPEFLEEIRGQNLDLVISFSSPCIFPPNLLEIPRRGCINLHCSLLPNYAGVLPSFWTLYHGEKTTGITVHYMDDKIDNGSILGQVEVDISDCRSMFQVIRKTKRIGGDLMVDVVEGIRNETAEPRPNDVSKGSYFSWPTVEQLREFRKKGGRLI